MQGISHVEELFRFGEAINGGKIRRGEDQETTAIGGPRLVILQLLR